MHKLEFKMIPDGCWNYNLRYILSKEQWDYIKKYAKEKANNKCSICGKETKFLDAHECWSFDEKKGICELIDVIAVCKDCHSVIHIGHTQLKGNAQKAEDHYMKVNGVSYSEMRRDLGKANEEQKRLNKVSEWKLDITWLKTLVEEDDGNN